MSEYQNYINNGNNGRYIILKVSNSNVLESMRGGEFWFRHPAFFNYAQNSTGNIDLGDKYDNKLKSIKTDYIFLPQSKLKMTGELGGYNLDCEAKIQYFEYASQDENRQISFYKLSINSDMNYSKVDKRMSAFGDSFALIDIRKLLDYLKKQSYEFVAENCNYQDSDTYSDKCGVFFKRIYYSYQNEYRINIFDKKYQQQLVRNEELQSLLLESDLLIQATYKGTTKERCLALDKLNETELQIEKIKSGIVEKIHLGKDYLSETLTINSLLNNLCISEWK